MFGRFKEHEDEPTWREKLAYWRDAPRWVPHRPAWLAESPASLVMLLVALPLAAIAIVYLVVAPANLPEGVPGAFDTQAALAAAREHTTTSTTTTTRPEAYRAAMKNAVAAFTPEQRKAYLIKIAILVEQRESAFEAESILATPATPRLRRFDLAIGFGALAVISLIAAWFLSDARARRQAGL